MSSGFVFIEKLLSLIVVEIRVLKLRSISFMELLEILVYAKFVLAKYELWFWALIRLRCLMNLFCNSICVLRPSCDVILLMNFPLLCFLYSL